MKFASFDRVISPEVGACIAGYGVNQHSVCEADDLAKAAIMGLVDAQRNPARFILENPPVGGMSKMMTSRKRNKCRGYLPAEHDAGDTVRMELQAVAIGDVCFVGVPGELCNEYGLEIKWHSPFRKAFIAYVSTAYLHYICQTNFVVSGGYEGDCQIFTTRDSVLPPNNLVIC